MIENEDDSWIVIDDLLSDLEKLTEIPKSISRDFLKIIENLIVHKFIEKVNEIDLESDISGKDIEIVVPLIGSLVISIGDDKKISDNTFTMNKKFYNKLKESLDTRESPLVLYLSKIVGEDLVRRYVNYENGVEEEEDD